MVWKQMDQGFWRHKEGAPVFACPFLGHEFGRDTLDLLFLMANGVFYFHLDELEG